MKIIILLVLLISVQVSAGDKIGNGGQGIDCESSLQLIDYWYGKNFKTQNTFDLTSSAESDLNRLNWLIQRWKRLDPQRAEQYHLKALSLLKGESVTFVRGQELTSTADTDIENIPAQCSIKQIALQLKDLTSPFTILIQKDYFDQLSSVDRVGLIIHELLFFEIQSPTANQVREMGLLLVDQDLDKMSDSYYRSLLSRWGLRVSN